MHRKNGTNQSIHRYDNPVETQIWRVSMLAQICINLQWKAHSFIKSGEEGVITTVVKAKSMYFKPRFRIELWCRQKKTVTLG